jgi:hypothetical protein
MGGRAKTSEENIEREKQAKCRYVERNAERKRNSALV